MTIREICVSALAQASVEQALTARERAHLRALVADRLDVAVPGDVAVEKLCQAGVPCVVAGGVVLHFARIGQQPTFLDLAMAIWQIAHEAEDAGEENAPFAKRLDAAACALLDAEVAT